MDEGAMVGAASAVFGLATALKTMRPQRFRHTSCYCEENVWRLCEDLLYGRSEEEEGEEAPTEGEGSTSGPVKPRTPNPAFAGRVKAVFISNKEMCMPLWRQKAGGSRSVMGEPGFVLWDYHVLAVLDCGELGCHVLDLDTNLESFPTPFEEYVERALRPKLVEACASRRQLSRRMFRVVPAEEYLGALCSDRSHMLNKETGLYMAQPPREAPVTCKRPGCVAEHSTNLFREFVGMDPGSGFGEVLTEQDFLRRFGAREAERADQA